MDMLQQNGHVGIVWTEDVPRASPSATRRPDSGETRSNEGEMAGQRPPFALVGLDLNGVPLFCTTEFWLHLSTAFFLCAQLACFRLGFEKSAPHRAISTEQYQHRNKTKGGSPNYSPPVLPFFASRPFSRILQGSWSARLRVLASRVGHADPPCYYGGSI